MSTVLSALVDLAEAIRELRTAGWWIAAVAVVAVLVWAWGWLRPTGKRRRPRPRRCARPAPSASAEDMDGDPAACGQAPDRGGEGEP